MLLNRPLHRKELPVEPRTIAKNFKATNYDRVRYSVIDKTWEVCNAWIVDGQTHGIWTPAKWQQVKKWVYQVVVRMQSNPPSPAQWVEISDILKVSMAYPANEFPTPIDFRDRQSESTGFRTQYQPE